MAPHKENPRQQWLKDIVRDKFEGSLTALSQRVKMDYTGLNLMVNGRRSISEKTVYKLCSRLNVKPPADLPVVEIESKVETPTHTSAREAQLVEMVNRLLNTNEQLLTRLGTMERVMQSLWDEVRANRGDLGKLPAEVVRAMKTASR